jgi:RHS repeat-associated protein
VNTTNNQLGVPAGQPGAMTYDEAGNLTNDTYTGNGNRTYDAENRITSAWGGNNQAQLYSYDASGRRIKRTVDGVVTRQVYGFGGELLAEYPADGPITSPQKEYGYRNGQLLVTAEAGTGNTQSVVWTNVTGVSASGNTLTKTGAAGWNAGAVSTQTISAGDGYVEFTASETNLARMCGLGNSDASQNYTDIEFAIQLTASNGTNGVWVFESGTLRGNFGTYSGGDKFRVAVESGVVKYKKNGTVFYTSSVTPAYPLLVDTSLYSTSSTLTNVVLSGGSGVSFTNATGVSVSGNTMTKTGAAGWNAGAVSAQTITSGNGFVEFTANETNLARMCGLGNGDSGQNYTDIEFAIQLTASDGANGVWVFESGALRGNFGTYSAGDKFQVAVESGVVKYKKNGTVFYTSSVTPTYPLLVDTSLYSTGSTVSNVVFSAATSGKIQWLVSDHLGTPRLIIDQTGTAENVKRHDYLPFGEELFAPAGRTTALGYAAGDGIRQQFTQKERDNETGLDYFLARYYSSTQGRFTSSDSFGGSTFNPQTLNLYSYVNNNPLAFTDPTGHYAFPGSEGDPCNGQPLCQDGKRPTATKPEAPPGYEIKPDGTLTKTGGKAVVEEAVTVTAKRGLFRRVFSRVGRFLGFGGGPIGGAGHILIGDMIDPQPVGGGDADLGYASMPWLTEEVQGTFAGNVFNPHRLEQDTTFYRYFDAGHMIGPGVGYLSADLYSTSKEARARLALSPKVTRNTASMVVDVTVPAGTIVAIGRAKGQEPTSEYPGGGSQVVIGSPGDMRIRYGTPRRLP